MPTGYTADVQDGKVTSFREFAMQCARAFGALVMMRDDPKDAPIPDALKVEDYYVSSVQRCEVELGRLIAMSSEDAARASAKAYADSIARAAEYKATKATQRQRYEAMIAKVEAWTPPSPDHEGMKKFMLEQLRESLRFDCGDYEPTVEPTLSGHEWRLHVEPGAHRDRLPTGACRAPHLDPRRVRRAAQPRQDACMDRNDATSSRHHRRRSDPLRQPQPRDMGAG